MKYVFRKSYGTPDDLQVLEGTPQPPAANELQIRVLASTVNRTDLGVLSGQPYIFRFFAGWPKPKYNTTGTDFAGVVEQVGDRVTRFKAGDQVWGFLDHGLPSHAHFMTISDKTAMQLKPERLSFEQTAASAEGAHYAYNIIKHARISGKERILVYGATGAIGSALVQLLKYEGCEVTAVYDSRYGRHPDSLETIVTHLGADKVIDAAKVDFTAEIGQYDGVLDAVGKSRFKTCKVLLKPKGYFISTELGPEGENIFLALSSPFRRGKKIKFPIPSDIQGSLDYLKKVIDAGAFKPVMDRSFKIEEIRKAFAYVMSEMKVGNVWIDLK